MLQEGKELTTRPQNSLRKLAYKVFNTHLISQHCKRIGAYVYIEILVYIKNDITTKRHKYRTKGATYIFLFKNLLNAEKKVVLSP